MRHILPLFLLLYLCQLTGQNSLRQLTFVNLLPHTEYIVTVYLDGRPHWAQIPPGRSENSMVHFPVYEWTDKITVSVSPAWESKEKPTLTPKGGHVGQMQCVVYHSPYVWDINPSCWQETCMTFYLNNEKMPRP